MEAWEITCCLLLSGSGVLYILNERIRQQIESGFVKLQKWYRDE